MRDDDLDDEREESETVGRVGDGFEVEQTVVMAIQRV